VRVLSYHFEYDAANKVLAARFTVVTDEVLKEFFEAAPRYIAAHAVEAGIVDFTAVTLGRLIQQSSSVGREQLRIVRSLNEVYLQLRTSAGSFTRLP
jgi:hypothetical protein